MNTDRSTLDVVMDVLRHELPTLRRMQLFAETPLLSAGLLDSFAVVTLLSALEEALSIDIDVDNTDLEEFESANSITALCTRAKASQTQKTRRV